MNLILLHLDFSRQDLLVVLIVGFKQGRGVKLVWAFRLALTAVDAVLNLFHVILPLLRKPRL